MGTCQKSTTDPDWRPYYIPLQTRLAKHRFTVDPLGMEQYRSNGLLTRMSHKFSTALRNVGADAALVGFATLQGVDPASPANLLDARTSTRPSFARHEFCETCGLI